MAGTMGVGSRDGVRLSPRQEGLARCHHRPATSASPGTAAGVGCKGGVHHPAVIRVQIRRARYPVDDDGELDCSRVPSPPITAGPPLVDAVARSAQPFTLLDTRRRTDVATVALSSVLSSRA